MPTSRLFAYNTGATIDNTIQIGSLAVSTGGTIDFSQNNVTWYNGPDEDLGYCIGYSATTQPVPGGGTAQIQFWRSKLLTNVSFVGLSEFISRKYSTPQSFSSATNASSWLTTNGFWNSYKECGPSSFLTNSGAFKITTQSDGKILVGGSFSTFGTSSSNYILRLNSDGSLDDTFSIGIGFDNTVRDIQIQSDGKILVCGDFTSYNGVSKNRIVRLNSDGSIDNTFSIGTGFNNRTFQIQIQSDGKILVCGGFSLYNGISRNRIIRLNIDGSVDTTLSIGSGFNVDTFTVKIQSNGKILVGGLFTSYSGVSINRIVRLNSDGSIDNSFTIGTGFNSPPYDIDIQSDEKILVGGEFTSYSGVTSNYIIRLNSNGSIDNNTFDNFINSVVFDIEIQTDGKILVGLNSGIRLIRFNTDCSFDNTFFAGGPNSSVRSIRAKSNGNILVGGFFTLYFGIGVGGIIELSSEGISVNVFNNLYVYEQVQVIQIQSDGKILAGGSFTRYNDTSINRILRLNSDGSIDTTFSIGSGFNAFVSTIEIQSDGKILIGGNFFTYNGTSIGRIIRLNSNGSIDDTFSIGSGFNGATDIIKIQSDGKILVGGNFTSYSGVSRNRIIRLNSDGSIDDTFSIGSGFNSSVSEIKIQSDGKILVGGNFTSYNNITSRYLLRLNSDGSIDGTFQQTGLGLNNNVLSIKVQSDGKILVGGFFSLYNGFIANRIIRLNSNGVRDDTFSNGNGFNDFVSIIETQSDGKILIGGFFTTYDGSSWNKIIRLNSNGSVDNSFSIGNGFGGTVLDIKIQYDGNILVSGLFSYYNTNNSNSIALLSATGQFIPPC